MVGLEPPVESTNLSFDGETLCYVYSVNLWLRDIILLKIKMRASEIFNGESNASDWFWPQKFE